jgi:hypothetical protein
MNNEIDFIIMPKGYGKASKEIRDYITNLQRENERLKMYNDMLRKDIDSFLKDREKAEKEYKSKVDDIGKLTSNIYKAIKYINENDKFSNIAGCYEFYGDPDELINILEDKE